MNAILRSLDNIDEQTELQCLYLEKIEYCQNLEIELSKSKTQQTDKHFANLKQHFIDLELALQHESEKNVCENSWVKQSLKSGDTEKALKEQNDSLIAELNHKTLEINDLKAQFQYKTMQMLKCVKIPIGQRFSLNKTFDVYVKRMPPRSGLTWKPTGRIFTYVGLRWIPTRKTVETCINMNDSDLPLGKETCAPNTIICANSSSLSVDHNLWDIIVNGDLEDEATPSGEQSSPPVPKTAKQLAATRNQERITSILLLAIPDEYLLKFHNVPDAKSLWAAIKSRFGGNKESKKMQKNVLKHQFENFVTASNETLDKAYDRFQKLISQLEIHGAYVSKEDINQKFLRSLPPSWSQIALIMRNKPDIDEVDIDDLYNNLRVYEDELKSTASGDFGVSTAGGINQVPSTPSAHDIAYSFLAQPTTSPQLENEDFQQMDGDDLEELDLRWQVAMLTVRVKKFIQRTGRNMDFKEKRHVSLDKSKIECYNCHRKGHFARECRSGRSQGRRPYGDNGRSNAQTTESSSQALVAQDGLGGYDWSNDFEVEPVNYALMAISSSNSSSSSDSEVQKCSKQCLESFKCLQKNYDTEREKHNKAKLEIRGYEIALESLEARILGHEKNELAWGERYEFQNYDLKCREIKINNLNLELEKVVKEKMD
ncbi:ribonuclease H-like domain-containing protein [Tanacetum coccineum]